jgi:3-hydroxybutyryl-CoA dehydrogenase
MPKKLPRPWPPSKPLRPSEVLPTREPLPITVAIIGAGPLGRWLALAAARAGYRVLLEDVMPANLHHAQEYLRQQLGPELLGEALQAKGTGISPYLEGLESAGASAPEGRLPEHSPVAFVSTIEDAVRDADLAIDCVPDELESKLEILWLLDRMAPPRTVLATPTTRQSIADLANCTYRAGQCIAIAAEASALTGNPASGEQGAAGAEIQLRTTSRTTPETVALLDGFWRKLGFNPTFAPDPAEKPADS